MGLFGELVIGIGECCDWLLVDGSCLCLNVWSKV